MKRVAKHVTTGVALLVAAAMVLALVGTAVAKPIKIRFSHVVSPNTPKGQAADCCPLYDFLYLSGCSCNQAGFFAFCISRHNFTHTR